MESSRLKNIIILILLFTNLFLLGSLGMRTTVEHSSHRQAAQELVSLFAKVNIALEESSIPSHRAPEGRVLARDAGLDRKMAAFLLGDHADEADRGGGILAFTGKDGGSLQLRASGAFDGEGPFADGGKAEDFCRSFCRKFGYNEPVFAPDGLSATATQTYDGHLVTNCTVTFTIDNGAITAVYGTHLPNSYTAVYPDPTGKGTISAVTALTTFLDARRQLGAVVSAVTEVVPCYELQSSAAAPMNLAPAWRIGTDIGFFYVNAYTGTVTYN